MVSKLFELPIKEVEDIHYYGTNSRERESIPHHRIYSAHDTQIANILAAIAPNYQFETVPYACTIYIELHSLKENPESLYLRVLYNGIALENFHCSKESFCTLEEFRAWMSTYLVVDQPDQLKQMCAATPTEGDFNELIQTFLS
jgi:hypothetical protein